MNKLELQIEGKKAILQPSPQQIVTLLSKLDGKSCSYAILANDARNYIQCSGSAETGFSIEYQAGSKNKHFLASKEASLTEVTSIFHSYASGSDEWKRFCFWKPMEGQMKGFRIEMPKLSMRNVFSAILWMAGLLAFWYFVGGARRVLWICIFSGLVLFTIFADVQEKLTTGVVYDRYVGDIKRSESPGQFWYSILTGCISGLIVIVMIVWIVWKTR